MIADRQMSNELRVSKKHVQKIMEGDSMFAHPDFIETYLNLKHKKLAAQIYFRGMDKEKFTAELARHYGVFLNKRRKRVLSR